MDDSFLKQHFGDRFVFQERHGKLDLRSIARVDVDRVVQETDVDALQAHLANITFSKLDVSDLKRCARCVAASVTRARPTVALLSCCCGRDVAALVRRCCGSSTRSQQPARCV
jgi:hypothetical protein